MKRFLFISCLALLFAAGCNAETSSEPASQIDDTTVAAEDQTADQEEIKVPEKAEEEPTEDGEETEPVEAAIEVSEPQYKLTENWNLVPLSEEVNEDIVLLTIDDAPDEHALQMAETLKELEAKAIFFVNGHFLDTPEEKEALKKIYEMGFAIGNHTYNHQALPEVAEEVQQEEILKLNDLVEEITGERPSFFRAPHGMNTDYAKQLVKDEGMLLMNWSYGYDFNQEYMEEDAIADIMVNTELLRAGSNLLMHDREWTAAALEAIVKGLRDKGYEMVDPALIQLPE